MIPKNRRIGVRIAVRSKEPGDAQSHAAQGRKAAPEGGPIETKSGWSITPKSGGPIPAKSGGPNHSKSCTQGHVAIGQVRSDINGPVSVLTYQLSIGSLQRQPFRTIGCTQPSDHGDSGYRPIHAGVDGLALRVQMIRHAERTLDLQYFIFRGDETGTLIREELRHAADRGVRVRVLVDDGDTRPGDEQLLELDGHDNLQVRVFNPFDTRSHNPLLRNLDFVFHKARLDYRMHNKLLVADSAIALIGGRNVGNQYFQVDPDSQFADDEVFVAGAMAQDLSHEFDVFWNADTVVPARRLGGLSPYRPPSSIPVVPQGGSDYLARVDSNQPYQNLVAADDTLTWTSARLVYDSPEKREIEQREQRGRLMSRTVEQEIASTQGEALIVSPYFVPSERETSLLEAMPGRHASVKALTNSLQSAPSLAAQSGYGKIRARLLRAGMKLFEVRADPDSTRGSGESHRISRYGNYGLHAKLYVFDRRRFFIGSWNYDQRSLRINTEMGLVIENAKLAQEIAGRFEAMTSPGAAYQVLLDSDGSRGAKLVWETEVDHQVVRSFKEPSRGWLQRTREKLLGLLPLQPEL